MYGKEDTTVHQRLLTEGDETHLLARYASKGYEQVHTMRRKLLPKRNPLHSKFTFLKIKCNCTPYTLTFCKDLTTKSWEIPSSLLRLNITKKKKRYLLEGQKPTFKAKQSQLWQKAEIPSCYHPSPCSGLESGFSGLLSTPRGMVWTPQHQLKILYSFFSLAHFVHTATSECTSVAIKTKMGILFLWVTSTLVRISL